MPLRFSESADADFDHIYGISAELFGFEQADRYAEKLRDACNLLVEHPHIARERVEMRDPVRAYRMQSHMIIYEVEADGAVLILRFRHVREDWQSDPING